MAYVEHALHGRAENEAKPLEYQDPEQSIKILGFWIFLATDMLLFGCLFATYLVLRTHTDGGLTAKQLFDVPGFAAETFLLLTSSFTGGLATLAMRNRNKSAVMAWIAVTVLLGLGFLGFEISEFTANVARGATMQRSAFLSAFYTLVGTHGLHVSIGIGWMIVTWIQIARRGITRVTARKLFIVNLYWHFLDVVWVFIFTVVYLSGVVM
ncbi:cytochrome (ubi)quinol oxidase subunit III [Ferroacidibacillus organovorans]|uniref:Cytochrome o ubiquinol oxidase subunit III n=1 Tax=Ferroacidibacillus organovorans TaxID=1765683 RepID=A0A117SY24_9BACL|nr:cytochrome (ubi)quinol oxidase subunit III [Ferroacidibacillus organovorans]KUO96271.1 cytochrome o ubiquinol oxidase subunit III [Ferroacidibacillus organovorans]